LDLSPFAAELALTLAETNVAYADTASATVAVTDSVLNVQGGAVTWEGTLVTPRVAVGPLAVDPGTLTARAAFGAPAPGGSDGAEQPWSFVMTSADGSLAASSTPAGFALDILDLPFTSVGTDLPVAGSLSGTIAPAAP